MFRNVSEIENLRICLKLDISRDMIGQIVEIESSDWANYLEINFVGKYLENSQNIKYLGIIRVT